MHTFWAESFESLRELTKTTAAALRDDIWLLNLLGPNKSKQDFEMDCSKLRAFEYSVSRILDGVLARESSISHHVIDRERLRMTNSLPALAKRLDIEKCVREGQFLVIRGGAGFR